MKSFAEFINESIVDIPKENLDPAVFMFPDGEGSPYLAPSIKKQIPPLNMVQAGVQMRLIIGLIPVMCSTIPATKRSIPIFISDQFWLPFAEYIKWEKLAVLVTPEEIDQIPKIIDQIISQDLVKGMVEYGQMCYNKYLGWDGVTTTIKKIIENEK
jgi:hypothetical protein